MLIYYYPTCGTVKKALKWLDEKGLEYELKHIVDETMSEKELKEFWVKSELPLKRFFNTSGKVYKETNFKEKQKNMTDDEIISFLVEHPMMLKRPVLIYKDKVLVGFKEKEYEEVFE